ncbi:hypothetical protein I302_100458 [Kwoniella bestiolae CBS 10118]|uniref:Uncharacterized protein n=1 Tax=Kwoniella bestiolae CBS 10118 TaxID=1296100 RepID=A0A1B9G543_9TREE|nr:hypothetical protein I302_03832 [Kwoniella bestiolae CBS 10118]OCF26154.1 hypothetical protein I302_03832 [Kwoniella bestiolae CBS 10118]
MSPKKIIVDGSNMTSIIGYPFGFPQNIWDEVEELTFICPPINFLPDPAVGGFPEWASLPLKKVNWIFFTKDRNSTWTLGRHHLNPDKREYGSGKFEDEYWSFGNFLLSFPSTVEIRIINSGMIHPYTIGSEHRDENYNQTVFAHKVRQSMLMEIQTRFSKNQQRRQSGNDERFNEDTGTSLEDQNKEADDRWSTIRWMGMKEYLRNNDWVGELDPSEAKVWLN